MRTATSSRLEGALSPFRRTVSAAGLQTLRDDARILGWRIDRTGTVHVPPKGFPAEPGAFVEVGPGARLLTLARDVVR